MKLYYVYIVKCKDDSFYIGFTNNLDRRLHEHNSGYNEKAYTFKRRPVLLQWYETFENPNEAIKVEKQLKGWSRRKKIALIEKDWEKLRLYAKNYTQFGNEIKKRSK